MTPLKGRSRKGKSNESLSEGLSKGILNTVTSDGLFFKNSQFYVCRFYRGRWLRKMTQNSCLHDMKTKCEKKTTYTETYVVTIAFFIMKAAITERGGLSVNWFTPQVALIVSTGPG